MRTPKNTRKVNIMLIEKVSGVAYLNESRYPDVQWRSRSVSPKFMSKGTVNKVSMRGKKRRREEERKDESLYRF